MKKLFLIGLLVTSLYASWETVQGQKNVTTNWIWWYTGSSSSDSIATEILFHGGNVYVDSSGTWVQIDNTADSCSKPFYLADESYMIHPVWLNKIVGSVRSPSTDSNSVQFNIQTREYISYKDSNGKYQRRFTDWFNIQSELSDDNSTVRDSIAFPPDSTGTTAKVWYKARFDVTGDQARLCPVTPAGITADSVLVDSLYYRGR